MKSILVTLLAVVCLGAQGALSSEESPSLNAQLNRAVFGNELTNKEQEQLRLEIQRQSVIQSNIDARKSELVNLRLISGTFEGALRHAFTLRSMQQCGSTIEKYKSARIYDSFEISYCEERLASLQPELDAVTYNKPKGFNSFLYELAYKIPLGYILEIAMFIIFVSIVVAAMYIFFITIAYVIRSFRNKARA